MGGKKNRISSLFFKRNLQIGLTVAPSLLNHLIAICCSWKSQFQDGLSEAPFRSHYLTPTDYFAPFVYVISAI